MSEKHQSVPLIIWIVIALLSADVLILGYSSFLGGRQGVFSRWNQESGVSGLSNRNQAAESGTKLSDAQQIEPKGSEAHEGLVLKLADELNTTKAELRELNAKLKIATSELERLYNQMADGEKVRGH